MKEFKLASWPELPAPYRRTVYRRLLSDLSQRHLCAQELTERSGLSRHEVREFLDLLAHIGVLLERDRAHAPNFLDSLGPLGGWLRRKLQDSDHRT